MPRICSSGDNQLHLLFYDAKLHLKENSNHMKQVEDLSQPVTGRPI